MKPVVLLTNDDSIEAPGLYHLWSALQEHCELYIVAPALQQSGVATAITLHEPIHIEQVPWEKGTLAWRVFGTPADCVRMAMRVLLPKTPHLITAGINQGGNAGRTLMYSGTVGGIIDGVIHHIPGIAFSCEDPDLPYYECFTSEIFPLVSYLLKHPLEEGSFLNVTFPSSFQHRHKGFALARQGLGYFGENPIQEPHPEGKMLYWMGGADIVYDEHEESDVSLLAQGYIPVVPLRVKELTDLHAFNTRKEHALFQRR